MQTDWTIRDEMVERDQVIRQNIAVSCKKAGRRPADVQIIAVSKTKPSEYIEVAKSLGFCEFGENRVQELTKKIARVADVKWHFIGHLQSNKVKYIIRDVALIHSLDRWKLAEEIEKQASAVNRVVSVLLQVNVSGEKSKFGLKPADVVDFYRDLHAFNYLKVCGLMTMAPLSESAEDVRYVFRELAKIQKSLLAIGSTKMNPRHLSMGMSQDYQVAIEEGATMIRIGTALFGKRE